MSRSTLKMLAGVAAFVVAAPLACMAMIDDERPVTRYETRADSEQDRGWIPDRVPPSATRLVEAHDIDTNARWLAFRASEDELTTMTSGLRPVADARKRHVAPHLPPRMYGEWPSELRYGFQGTPPGVEALPWFRDDAEGYCFAVDGRAGRAWGWSCGKPSGG